MNLKVFSLILAAVLAFTAFSSLGVFAAELEVEEEPTVEELVCMARLAYDYANFLRAGVYDYWLHYSKGRPLRNFDKWLLSKGFLPQTLETKDIRELLPPVDRHTGGIYYGEGLDGLVGEWLFYALPEGITVETLREEYYNLYYYDKYGIFDCTRKHPGGGKCFSPYFRVDDSGRVYTNCIEIGILPEDQEFWENEDMWNSARIAFKDSQKIILTMHYKLPYGQVEGDTTVEYRKTPNGWRVYNSAFMGGWGDLPETGDNTLILLTVTALSVLGLCALAVAVGRRKKERF